MIMLRLTLRGAAITALAMAALTACSGDGGDSSCGGIIEPTRVITLAPLTLTIDPGTDVQVAATLSGGCSTDDQTVRWSTADAAIATVDVGGRVRGVGGGLTILTATAFSDRATMTIPVTVRPRTATILAATPRLDTLSPLGTRPLTVTVRDQTGTLLSAAPVSFRSLTPGLATVSNRGVVTAIAAGTASIEIATQKTAADSLRDTVRVLIVTACALVRPLPLGATVSGSIDASSCQNFAGYRAVNQYSVTTAVPVYFAVRLAPSAPMALVPLVVNGTLHGLPVADTTTAFVVTRDGTFNLLATAPTPSAGAYTLTTQLDPDPKALCVTTDATLGVSFRTAVTPTCLGRDIRILPPLLTGQVLRVTGTATGFPVTLELRSASSGAVLQRAVATAAGATATITFTNTVANQLVRVRVIGPATSNDFVAIGIAP